MSGRPRLIWRNWRHARGASLLVSLLVAVVCVLLMAAPVAFSRMVASEFDQSINAATPNDRHLIASSTTAPGSGPVRDPEESDLEPRVLAEYGALDEQLAAIRETFPPELRGAVGAARWSVTTGVLPLGEERPDSDPRMAVPLIELRVDPRAAEHAALIEGVWPLDDADVEPETPVGVVLSEEAADRLAWAVGEVRTGFVLTGVFRPRDAGDDYWSLNDSMLQPFIFDDGNSQTRITATAFVDPLRYVDAFADAPVVVSLKLWYPLELGATAGADTDDVLAQLRGMTAKTFTRTAGGLGGIASVELSASGIPVLEGAQGRTDAARSVLTLAATGPLGSALVVLVLAVRAFGNRRRHAIGLLAARGASRLDLRMLLLADGVVAGVLPAVVVIALARWQLGDELPIVATVLAAVVGLVPAGLLTTARIDAAIRPTRVDTGVRSRSKNRWVVEVLLVALAAASVYLLVANGLAPDERGGDVDVLVAATPMLLAGAACVVVLRVYPLPMQALSRWLRRGRSTIGFLGSIRALRDPAVGVAPVLAVLAGVAIAVFSAVVLSTLDRGAQQAALLDVGADLRFDGTLVTDDQLAGILDVPGVVAAARVQHAAPRSIAIPGRSADQTAVYLADLDQLGAAQEGVPGGYDAGGSDGVVVSSELETEEATITYSGGSVPVIASFDQLPGVTGEEDRWVLVDGSDPGFGPFVPDSVLIALTDDVDRRAAREAVGTIVGGKGVFSDRIVLEADLRDDSISSGLRSALIAALAAAGLAAAATVVLTLVAGATARTRLLAILRVLGVTHRQRRWLAVWEQAPIASVALVVGGALGLGLALLVHAVVDLSPFAGGGFQPELTFQWLQITALIGGFVVLMMVAVGLGLVATRRTSAATAVRLDEE